MSPRGVDDCWPVAVSHLSPGVAHFEDAGADAVIGGFDDGEAVEDLLHVGADEGGIDKIAVDVDLKPVMAPVVTPDGLQPQADEPPPPFGDLDLIDEGIGVIRFGRSEAFDDAPAFGVLLVSGARDRQR